MPPFLHCHEIAAARPTGETAIGSGRLPTLQSALPAAFGGPGDRWSPETLVASAVADCFVLRFRAAASLTQLSWASLSCEAVGTADQIDPAAGVTTVTVRARLEILDVADQDKACRLLENAAQVCFVGNSPKARVHLEAQIRPIRRPD